MVQIDGSPHRWIHDCSPFCLTAAIDDATGKILAAKFTPTETTFAAMDVVEQIINKYGVFQMLYSDKCRNLWWREKTGFYKYEYSHERAWNYLYSCQQSSSERTD